MPWRLNVPDIVPARPGVMLLYVIVKLCEPLLVDTLYGTPFTSIYLVRVVPGDIFCVTGGSTLSAMSPLSTTYTEFPAQVRFTSTHSVSYTGIYHTCAVSVEVSVGIVSISVNGIDSSLISNPHLKDIIRTSGRI